MDTKEIIFHNIKFRRSIFSPSYIKQPIDRTVLKELLEYAGMAPNHKLTQPWRFIVFTDKGLERLANKMAALYKEQSSPEHFLQKKMDITSEKILRAGAVIAINIHYSKKLPQWEEVAAVGCAIQNLWLAATAKGIGGYWSSPESINLLHEFLGLGEDDSCLGLFYLGYHQEPERAAYRDPIENKITWIEK